MAEKMNQALQTFGIIELKNKQKEIIDAIINERRDICCILPTGYGKSLCYQLPPILLDRPALVISPLISLMEDQKSALLKKGITVCCYNSTVTKKNVLKDDILLNKYKIIYITPEQIVKSRLMLEMLHEDVGLSLIAVDEAHCVSMWGHTFRTQYRELSAIKEWFPNVPIIALTGTATDKVEIDICNLLNLKNPLIVKSSFDRPNLYLKCHQKTTLHKDLLPLFNKDDKTSTIIYCITRNETESIAQLLTLHNIISKPYHAGMNDRERTEIHHGFLNNEIQCIVATNSFGMGIDKHDIRKIIHYGSPKDIESYYQEIGRGSRDGLKCECVAFFSRNDFNIQRHFIEEITNIKYRQSMYEKLRNVEKYMYSITCRRKIILEYFLEVYNDTNDMCCDNCVKESNINEQTIYDDLNDDAKLLLNTINEFDGKFGINTMINIIKGSKSKTLPFYCLRSPFYGKSTKTCEWWKNFSQTVINKGFVYEKKIDEIKNKYCCVVCISAQGKEYLKNSEQMKNIFISPK